VTPCEREGSVGAAKVWSLAEMSGPNRPEPAAQDPNTNGEAWKMWMVASPEDKDFGIVYAVVAPGHSTGVHRHPDIHYSTVVKGTALVWIDGEMVELNAGDVLHIPEWGAHDFGSTKEDEVWVVDLSSPPFDPATMEFLPDLAPRVAADFEKANSERAARKS
jgi:quercetin dioxygenase-like cupin family protein